jgi:hypothetical protein
MADRLATAYSSLTVACHFLPKPDEDRSSAEICLSVLCGLALNLYVLQKHYNILQTCSLANSHWARV